jgi:SAM-dependent methyltransferase
MDPVLIEDAFSEERTHWWHQAKNRLLCGFIKGCGMDILVAGIGGASLCETLAIAGHRVTAVDISPLACANARQAGGVRVLEADLEGRLSFDNGSFDIVVASDVIEHLEHAAVFLNEARRCLKDGGLLLVTVPAYAHLWSSWDVRLGHKRRYTAARLREDLTASRFRIEKMSFFHALLYPAALLRRKVFAAPQATGCQPSEFSVGRGAFIRCLAGVYYGAERFFFNLTGLPFGLSIFVAARKNG